MSVAGPAVLSGRYELYDTLGTGGMATVYRGTDRVLGRAVAVKVLSPNYAGDAEFVARFRREAQAAARLNHPGVVSVYDSGSDEGSHYIVMELVEGRTLGEVLAEEGSLSPDRAAEIAEWAARALSFAHAEGLVHRDVKPGNIMITGAGSVKVVDFGIARAAGPGNLTQTATVLGTAAYLSPEQAQSQPVDARSDLYSLGVVLYEMLAGRAPFTGDSAVAVAYKHVGEEPVPPSRFRKDVPPALEAVTMRALAKDPSARYQSAAEMGADLARVRAGEPLAAGPAPGATTLMASQPTATQRMAPEGPRRRRPLWPLALAAALVIAVIVVAALLASQFGSGGSPARTGPGRKHPSPQHSPTPPSPTTPTTPPATTPPATPTPTPSATPSPSVTPSSSPSPTPTSPAPSASPSAPGPAV